MSAMLEEDARRCWCPFARSYTTTEEGDPVTFNRTWQGVPKATNCLGSQCMAWRWHGPSVGTCGLAGSPYND